MHFENLCTLPLSSELFAQALHPTEPLLAVGLSTGHVECFRLPAADRSGGADEHDDVSVLSDGRGTIDTVWRTRRHKGSCRTVTFSGDGSALYSSGTDGIVKHFSPTTGQVASKFAIPSPNKTGVDAPTVLHILSPQTLILGCDSGILHLVDLRDHAIAGAKPQQSHYPHMDFVSSISPLPPSEQSTSGFSKQWVSTGGTTLAVTDVRRGVLVRSEDQEDELLSSVFVPGLGPKKNRELGVAAVGGATGVLTLWDKGAWDDQQDRVTVDRGGESLDCVVQIPEIVAGSKKKIAIGVGDGTVRVVDLYKREVEGSFRHDEEEAVLGLGFDCQGRMISGGGKTVKVWQEVDAVAVGDDDSDDSDDGDSDVEDAGDADAGAAGSKEKRQASSDEDSDSDSDGPRKRGKKKRRKGKAAADLGPYGAHGIMKFKGLD